MRCVTLRYPDDVLFQRDVQWQEKILLCRLVDPVRYGADPNLRKDTECINDKLNILLQQPLQEELFSEKNYPHSLRLSPRPTLRYAVPPLPLARSSALECEISAGQKEQNSNGDHNELPINYGTWKAYAEPYEKAIRLLNLIELCTCPRVSETLEMYLLT